MIFENEKPRLRGKLAETYMDNGAVRWVSSDNAVPADIMDFWHEEGMVDVDTVKRTAEARSADAEKHIAAYIEARANMTDEQRAEEAFEMRAAFGAGETVVNVFTGEKFIT